MNVKRVPVGIKGLDELINGGFPRNTVNLLSGPAGSAKTLLGLQFIYNGAVDHDETGIYITLEENKSNIVRAMANYGMDLEELEKEGKMIIIDLSDLRMKVEDEAADGNLIGFSTLQSMLKSLISRTGAKRLSLDSLTALGLFYGDEPGKLRREMFRLATFLKESGITSLLITESIEGKGLTRYGIEQFISDSFIVLGLEDIKGELRRTITVRKMRFTKHDTAKHPLLIQADGMQVQSQSKVY